MEVEIVPPKKTATKFTIRFPHWNFFTSHIVCGTKWILTHLTLITTTFLCWMPLYFRIIIIIKTVHRLLHIWSWCIIYCAPDNNSHDQLIRLLQICEHHQYNLQIQSLPVMFATDNVTNYIMFIWWRQTQSIKKITYVKHKANHS